MCIWSLLPCCMHINFSMGTNDTPKYLKTKAGTQNFEIGKIFQNSLTCKMSPNKLK